MTSDRTWYEVKGKTPNVGLGYVDTDPDPSPNPGARRLRKYWTKPGQAGYAKIAWGTPGDWRRCVNELREHVGPGAEGLCSVYHRQAVGFWPGDRRNK